MAGEFHFDEPQGHRRDDRHEARHDMTPFFEVREYGYSSLNLNSEGLLFRRSVILKVRYSEGQLFRRFVIVKVRYSEGLFSEGTLF